VDLGNKIEILEKKNSNKKITVIILSAVLIFILLSSILLLLLGFRPVEDTDVIIQYDVIYIFVQIAAVIALIVTVVYQVINSKKISERQEKNNKAIANRQEDLLKKQNDIALFEKRYELLKTLIDLQGECKYFLKHHDKGSFNLLAVSLYNNDTEKLRELEALRKQVYMNQNAENINDIKNELKEVEKEIELIGTVINLNHNSTLLKAPILFSDDIALEILDFTELVKKLKDKNLSKELEDIKNFKQEVDQIGELIQKMYEEINLV
jgi:DNA repair exonuclease SbcCD ATPase subunit